MMKIAIFGRHIEVDNKVYVLEMLNVFEQKGFQVIVYEPFWRFLHCELCIEGDYGMFDDYDTLVDKVDMVLTLGGDGTILDVVPLIRDSGIPILGVNMGRLGFLSSVSKTELLSAIEAISMGQYDIEERTLLRLLTPPNDFGKIDFALNELNVLRRPENSLLTIKVFVDNLFLNTYWADGVIVATPTGSTAYSLSAGGPIIAPNSKSFVITPVATHNLTVRPIVIPDDSVITIRVEGRDKNFVLNMDSRTCVMSNKEELVMKKAPFSLKMVQLRHNDFFSTIRNKLMWGKDNRN